MKKHEKSQYVRGGPDAAFGQQGMANQSSLALFDVGCFVVHFPPAAMWAQNTTRTV